MIYVTRLACGFLERHIRRMAVMIGTIFQLKKCFGIEWQHLDALYVLYGAAFSSVIGVRIHFELVT